MENDFERILNKNEQIIQTYKPNKAKIFLSSFLGTIFGYIFLLGVSIFGYFVPDEDGSTMPLAACITILILAVVVFILQIIFTAMAYRKRVYCITNQRLIIRCGVIGVDYKSLDLKYIGAVDVYVSFLDKLIHKNTGTLRFGSNSSPMMNSTSLFCFSGITAPYETYQSIKEIIDNNHTTTDAHK